MYNEFATRTVTVDTTPPTQPNVTGGENSCSLEDIEIKAVSGDTVSGVRRYYYNLTVHGIRSLVGFGRLVGPLAHPVLYLRDRYDRGYT